MLQIRVSVPEFSSGVNFTDPIILEKADNIELKKTVNSSDESISFDLPLNDPKMQYINDIRWWECWDTETNERKNFGPITSISRAGGESKKIGGPGRSALLLDYYKSIQTFYKPIDVFFEELRYENLVSEPKTTTIINQNTSSDYYGLSKRTKDYAIDEQTGYIAMGRDTPERGTIKVAEYWSGIGKADYLIIDLGEPVAISKLNILFPWWSGATINNAREYDWDLYYSNDNVTYTLVNTPTHPNRFHMDPRIDGVALYFGDTGFAWQQLTPNASPITARYWKIDITNTYSFYGNLYVGTLADVWDWECGGSNYLFGESYPSPSVSSGDLIPKDTLSPSSDCHASIVEVGVKKKILDTDTITNLSYHQIQDDNRQISYYHTASSLEMISTESSTVKKYEPGTFFRNIVFDGSGVTVQDEYNTILYTGGGGALQTPAYCRMLKFSGDASVNVTSVDAWLGQTDAYSFGGSYSYSKTINDYAILDFRGVSLIWYATIPSTETPAHVKIEIRDKSTGTWGAWSTLEASYALPNDVAGEKVWEITYESNTLSVDVSYQLRITNLDGGYVSIDAFAGYWTATMTTLNEDDAFTRIRDPRFITQMFDGKFLNGSINRFDNPLSWEIMESVIFTGDRFIVYSRKLPGSGVLKVGLWKWPEYYAVPIPGGLADGTIDFDLNSTTELPQAVLIDSNDHFTDGLPWGTYGLGIYTTTGSTGPIWFDGFSVHQTNGISAKFVNQPYQEIVKSTAEALQMEWDITENGLKIVPRIGVDTNIIKAEGRGTTVKVEDVQDLTKVATQLIISGADIDGLPLTGVVENRKTKKAMGRTIQRAYDLRSVADQFTLIGAGRTELARRDEPERRITVTSTTLEFDVGDTFIVKNPEIEKRVRAVTVTRKQSVSGGTEYVVECGRWPMIV